MLRRLLGKTIELLHIVGVLSHILSLEVEIIYPNTFIALYVPQFLS